MSFDQAPGGQEEIGSCDPEKIPEKILVIGVGPDGPSALGDRWRKAVLSASLLAGGQYLLDMFPDAGGRRLPIRAGLGSLAAAIRETRAETRMGTRAEIDAETCPADPGNGRIVVLASGDPGFFGVASFLLREFGREQVEIVPAVSWVQLAFARIGETWEDAAFFSVHGRSLDELAGLAQGLNPGLTRETTGGPGEGPGRNAAIRKLAILTDHKHNPAAVASFLLSRGVPDCPAFVCERLGSEERERIWEGTLRIMAQESFDYPNIVILKPAPGSLLSEAEDDLTALKLSARPVGAGPGNSARPNENAARLVTGIRDEEFQFRAPRRGMITKREVRILCLASLGLREDSVVWDVGAGSGSVAVEAALAAPRGRAVAFERNPEAVEHIRANAARFGAVNLEIRQGEAPETFEGAPPPDAVFVGGSGGRLREILRTAAARLTPGGRLTVNAATVETLHQTLAALKEAGFAPEVIQVQVSRGRDLQGLTRFEALDPVWIITAEKGQGAAIGEVATVEVAARGNPGQGEAGTLGTLGTPTGTGPVGTCGIDNPGNEVEQDAMEAMGAIGANDANGTKVSDAAKVAKGEPAVGPGSLIGIGVGPGDPFLLTVGAREVLSHVPVVCFPRKSSAHRSYALSVVEDLLHPGVQELIPLDFPMTRDRAALTEAWREAARCVAERLLRGHHCAFLTEGDPAWYSTWTYLAEEVKQLSPGSPISVIPGISSISAASAAALLPLAVEDEGVAVLPASAGPARIEAALKAFETVVIMKLGEHLDTLIDLLDREGLADGAVYVERCGTPWEYLTRDVGALRGKKPEYFSLLVVTGASRAQVRRREESRQVEHGQLGNRREDEEREHES
ncbi:MAG: precorrin-2 C(20)-methyltransferase [Firmicutes bacterium]|nr:precorrin-2 C(20)-methyltransferase [Bacillota bacterium]